MIALLLALLAYTPYPPSDPEPDPPEIPSGECSIVGSSVSVQVDVAPALIVRCGISDETTRLFEIPMSETDLWVLARFLEVVGQFDDAPDDVFEVH